MKFHVIFRPNPFLCGSYMKGREKLRIWRPSETHFVFIIFSISISLRVHSPSSSGLEELQTNLPGMVQKRKGSCALAFSLSIVKTGNPSKEFKS